MDLFDHSAASDLTGVPLADRMRPQRLEDVVGQGDLLGAGRVLRVAIETDRIASMILWGPPGSGKTTIAKLLAKETKADFVSFSAVLGGVAELRKVISEAAERRKMRGRRTTLFIDEIHRFNNAQQDALLPHVERGTVTLIGATTENPSFAVNAALLSRARVLKLEPLDSKALVTVLERALSDRARGLGSRELLATEDVLRAIAEGARGDARRALNVLEVAAEHAAASNGGKLDVAIIEQVLAHKTLLYDKSGEEHYNVVSAFIKSMRGSDPDAAIYWMMRMLAAGDDPLFVLRRMIIFASEDIGNADPRALELTVAADAAFRRLGMPEGLFAMSQCCTYLACAPKSNACYRAFTAADADIRERGALPVPLKLRNAPTAAMKAWGYGNAYRYPHDEGGHAKGETYLPDELNERRYYTPSEHGFEAELRARLEKLRSR